MSGLRPPTASSQAAAQRMRANRSRGTKPEMAIVRELDELGIGYERHASALPNSRRTADFLLREARVAVYVDGCFWHSCPKHGTEAKANHRFWSTKLRTNVERDEDTNMALRAAGWRVIRIWEHEDPRDAASRIAAVVRAPRKPSASG